MWKMADVVAVCILLSVGQGVDVGPLKEPAKAREIPGNSHSFAMLVTLVLIFTVKSCVKSCGLCALFQLFGQASIGDRLIF